MDAIFRELASRRKNRWTRTQILHYLPAALHVAAEEYFGGERLSPPAMSQVAVEDVETPSLATALSDLPEKAAAAGSGTASLKRQDPPARELLIPPVPRDAWDVGAHLLDAIVREIDAVTKRKPRRFHLTDGRCIGPRGSRFVYIFRWSSDPDLHTPGLLWLPGGLDMRARVGGQSEGELRFEVLVEKYVGPRIKEARFTLDPSFLLRSLYQALLPWREELTGRDGRAGALFGPLTPSSLSGRLPDLGTGFNELQRHAVAAGLHGRISFVWGPPGTGKTHSLGVLIREAVRAGRRVLVVSPYNIAVDEAVLAAARSDSWGEDQIIRFGRVSKDVTQAGLSLEARLEAAAARSGLLKQARGIYLAAFREAEGTAVQPPSSVQRCLEGLGGIVMQLHQQDGAAASQVAVALRTLEDVFRTPEKALMKRAKVVGTTMALSLVSPLIDLPSFDQIIVDEASVLKTPEAVLLTLNTSRLTFFGDPKQLQPIVESTSEQADRWLRRHPFELAEIRRPQDVRGSCVMLTEQHRMAPPIRSLVSELFYAGVLTDGACPATGRILILDTSATEARAATHWIRMRSSRENTIHRYVVSQLLGALRRDESVHGILVLAPFLAQKRLYEQEAITGRVPGVRFATVHSSQGTESDVVLLDLVVAPGRGKSRFLDERHNSELRNLLNVAMSRAKRELIIVAHAEHIRREYPRQLLSQMLDLAERHGKWQRVPTDSNVRDLLRRSAT